MGLIKNMFSNKVIFYSLLALTAVGLLFNPLMVLPKVLTYALLTAAAIVAGTKLTGKGVKSLWQSFSGEQGDTVAAKQDKVNEAIETMGNGKDINDPIVKALVDKLRDNGLTVTTNWDVAKQVMDALPEKYSHLSENRDNVRGFVYKGKVFINPDKTDISVPIHEYTHIWAEALRQNNMNEWQNIVSLLKKETQLWEDTKKNYPYLETDDEIADEVLAQYSGSYGAEKLKGFIVEGDKPKTVFKNLYKALEEFWKQVAKMFDCHFKTVDEIADRALYDLMKGYNPQKNIDPHTSTLSDNKPLSNTTVNDVSQQQEDDSHLAALVVPVEETNKAEENVTIVPAPPVEPKAGKKIYEMYYDPLPKWAREDNIHVFELTRNGEHVGYGASYNVHGSSDFRKIDESLGKQLFDAIGNKMGDGHEEYKVVCGQDILELKDGSKTMQHIRDMYWPEQHLDKVVTAVLERAKDSTALSFDADQKEVIKEFLASYSSEKDKAIACSMAAYRIRCHEDAADICRDWLDDAVQELKDMAWGQERATHQGEGISR